MRPPQCDARRREGGGRKSATLLACGLLLAGCATATVGEASRRRCWVGEVVRAEAVRAAPGRYRLLLEYDDGAARLLLFDREPRDGPGPAGGDAAWRVRRCRDERVVRRALAGLRVEAVWSRRGGEALAEGFVVAARGDVTLYVGGERVATAGASRLRRAPSPRWEALLLLLPVTLAFDAATLPLQVVGWPLWLGLWYELGIVHDLL